MRRRHHRRSDKLAEHRDLEPDYTGLQLDAVLEEFEFTEMPEPVRAREPVSKETILLYRILTARGGARLQ